MFCRPYKRGVRELKHVLYCITYLMKEFWSEFCRLTRGKGIEARDVLYNIPDEGILV